MRKTVELRGKFGSIALAQTPQEAIDEQIAYPVLPQQSSNLPFAQALRFPIQFVSEVLKKDIGKLFIKRSTTDSTSLELIQGNQSTTFCLFLSKPWELLRSPLNTLEINEIGRIDEKGHHDEEYTQG